MKLKEEFRYQLIGVIEDPETMAVSLVQHGANKRPFSVLKSEGELDWVNISDEDKTSELKALAKLTHNIAPTAIQFPVGTSKEDVENYMTKFEDKSYKIVEKDGVYTVKSAYGKPDNTSKEIIMPSGIIYTLNKFNLSGTMKAYEKEHIEMSKKQSKDNKKEIAPTETVEKADSIESIKTDLVAALKALSANDMTAILDEVLPKEEFKSEESEETTEDSTEDEAKDAETVDAGAESEANENATSDNPEKEEKSEDLDSISELKETVLALREEVDSQVAKSIELIETVKELTSKLEALAEGQEAYNTKLEKSLTQDDAIEVITEMHKSITELASRIDNLEYLPAISDSDKVEKSEEIYNKSSGFLSKFI